MFGLFEGGRNSYLGIDFGTSSIKVIELKLYNQKPYLSNYGWVRLDFIQEPGYSKVDNYDEKLKIYLTALIEKIKPRTKNAYASIPGFNGLVTLIEFPEMKRSELKQAITFEAHKYIPTSLEEVSISWDIISKNGKGKEEKKKSLMGIGGKKEQTPQTMQVLLVAAPKDKVIKYESIVESAKLKVAAIELETFSVTRSLVGGDAGTYIIIDIGFRVCSIVLVEKGIVRVSRNIDVGGNDITSSISGNLNISKQRAEAMKKQDKDFINGKEAVIILPTLDLIINEAARTIRAYEEKNKESKINGVILSGGTAKLKGIDTYFSKKLNIKSIIGDPWKKITYDEKIEPIIKKFGTSFSVAVGLALRGIEEHRSK